MATREDHPAHAVLIAQLVPADEDTVRDVILRTVHGRVIRIGREALR
ncbi:hypothetical protein AB0K00_17545 [Dactylosporangium sp. NPDC049525]